jgi:hypothetical protein
MFHVEQVELLATAKLGIQGVDDELGISAAKPKRYKPVGILGVARYLIAVIGNRPQAERHVYNCTHERQKDTALRRFSDACDMKVELAIKVATSRAIAALDDLRARIEALGDLPSMVTLDIVVSTEPVTDAGFDAVFLVDSLLVNPPG